jgi:uncharacterized iron-regulated membrane protein
MEPDIRHDTNRFYLAAWRWHFYAGLFVVPFLLILATTGLVMLLSQPLDQVLHRDMLRVDPAGRQLSPEEQIRSVAEAHPDAAVTMFVQPRQPDRSTQISIARSHVMAGHAGHEVAPEPVTVFVDPYTGAVLGSRDPQQTPYAWASVVHGTLLMGTFGDLVMEVAAGFGVLLILTGLFLWWPRGTEKAMLRPQMPGGRRLGWRNLHASIGIWTSGVLGFFLVTGLSWTLVWGERIVQPYNSLPPAQATSPLPGLTHSSLDHGQLKQVPWVLEQTPMPTSGTLAGLPGIPEDLPVNMNTVVAFAHDNGFTGFRVNVPQDSLGVWTVSAATRSKDLVDPRRDRLLHIDQYSGRVLADYPFADYPLMGKAMAAGIALHQGDISILNTLANVLFCLAIITLCASGLMMWWKRRPAGVNRLVPPPMPKDVRAWKRAAVVMFVASLAFPLVALTLATVAILDFALVSRVPALRTALK